MKILIILYLTYKNIWTYLTKSVKDVITKAKVCIIKKNYLVDTLLLTRYDIKAIYDLATS